MCSWWLDYAQNILEGFNAFICAPGGKMMHKIFLKLSMHSYLLMVAKMMHKIFLKTSMHPYVLVVAKLMHKISLKTSMHPYVLVVAKPVHKIFLKIQCIHMCSIYS